MTTTYIESRKHHTVFRRAGALLIDTLVFMPLIPLEPHMTESALGRPGFLAWNILSPFLFTLYTTICHATWGQTFGKSVTGIYVLASDEAGPPRWSSAFLRDSAFYLHNLAYAAAVTNLILTGPYDPETFNLQDMEGYGRYLPLAVTLWVFVDLLMVAGNQKRRALHDFLGGTVVVTKESYVRRRKAVEG